MNKKLGSSRVRIINAYVEKLPFVSESDPNMAVVHLVLYKKAKKKGETKTEKWQLVAYNSGDDKIRDRVMELKVGDLVHVDMDTFDVNRAEKKIFSKSGKISWLVVERNIVGATSPQEE